MSLAEISLTLLVGIVVFGPAKLPMLAHHLGKLMSRIQSYQQIARRYWQEGLAQYQLEENKKKAEEAEALLFDVCPKGVSKDSPD